MMIMLPVLTVFGDCIGMVGGWIIAITSTTVSTALYISRATDAAGPWDLYSGLIKSLVFAWLIITIACHQGLQTSGGAEGVGRATTRSVVYALLALLTANAILTAIFFFF